jgi:TFIIF-interacting CTD phosphatase-like protein
LTSRQLIEKGVVSVEYTKDEGKKSKDTPQTTTTTGLKEEASGSQHTSASHPYGKPEEPFLPAPSKKYTLVMDLDETLVHYEDNGVMGQFYLRPYAQEFIDEMAKYYEVVIFTAALQDYADWIIDRLDSNKNIRHRLYRQHTSATNGNYHVKVSSPYRRTSPS